MYSLILTAALATGGDVPDALLARSGCSGTRAAVLAPRAGCSGTAQIARQRTRTVTHTKTVAAAPVVVAAVLATKAAIVEAPKATPVPMTVQNVAAPPVFAVGRAGCVNGNCGAMGFFAGPVRRLAFWR